MEMVTLCEALRVGAEEQVLSNIDYDPDYLDLMAAVLEEAPCDGTCNEGED